MQENTTDTVTLPGYPPADHERDHLNMYGGDAIWRYLFPLLINQNDQQPLLTAAAFAEFRQDTGEVMSILGEALFLTGDTGPATLDDILDIVAGRARTSTAFSKFIGVLTEAKSNIEDTAKGLLSAFHSIENGLEELADDLTKEAKEAAEAKEETD